MNCVSVDSIPLQDLGSCTDGSTVGPLYTGLSFKSMYVPDAGGLTPVVSESPSVTAYMYKNVDECNVDKNAGRVGAQSLAAETAALDDCLGPWSSGGQFNSTQAMCQNGLVVTTGYNSMDCSGTGTAIPMESGATDQCLPIDISGTVYGGYIRQCVGQPTTVTPTAAPTGVAPTPRPGMTGTLQNMVYTDPGCQGLPLDSDSAGVGVCLFDYDSANTATPYIILTANATAINVMSC